MTLQPADITWQTSQGLIEYTAAMAGMQAHVDAMLEQDAPGRVWLLEHPPLYTSGTSADGADLLDSPFPVHTAGRGGQYTYHGPGQRVAYVMLDLKRLFAPRPPDIRRFVWMLEEWLIHALAELGVSGERREGRVGIWVLRPDGSEEKIAALGIRVKRWVSFHGVALNVSPDLSHYAGIVPCGIREHGVTSLAALGIDARMSEVDTVLKRSFENLFA